MRMFSLLKYLHVTCALISIGGFALRGYWALRADPRLQHRLARVLPHLVDSVLLGSALGMLWLWQLSPFALNWLTAKLIALLVYIALGMVTLRFARRTLTRTMAYIAALLTAGYILSVALTHSAWGFVPLFAG